LFKKLPMFRHKMRIFRSKFSGMLKAPSKETLPHGADVRIPLWASCLQKKPRTRTGLFCFFFPFFSYRFPGRRVSFPPPARPLRALETGCSKKGCKPSTHFPYQGQNYLVCCIQPQKTIALKTQNQFLFICFYHSLSYLKRKTSGPPPEVFSFAGYACG